MTFDYHKVNKAKFDCVLCGANDYEPLVAGDRYSMGLETSGCKGCGLVQTSPRPSLEVMNDFYKFHYRNYYQSAATADASYVQQYRKNIRLAETVSRILEAKTLVSGARVLDVGCAEGTLFEQLNQQVVGLELFGIEPYEPFAEYARKTTGCSTFESLDSLSETQPFKLFDVIIVNHVLEHVSEPVLFLKKLMAILAPAGVLYIDVPDVCAYASAEDIHLAHIFHFSERTLQASCEKAGAKVVKIQLHNPPFHPKSVCCFAETGGAETAVSTSMATEVDAWAAVKNLKSKIKFYTLKMKVRKIPIVRVALNVSRGLRKRNS